MNLTPIYELRSRLRTAMITGTNLISEDFRLKRAVEEIKPLEALSPVFAKIGQLTGLLLSDGSEDKEGILIDTITLVDALLCTQGQVAVTEEIEPIRINSWGSVVTNVPYSLVKTLVEALNTSGNGHYQFVLDTHEKRPQLFKDYRVKAAMVKALGASYTELAEEVTRWLKKEGEEIVPLLQKDFDPAGKKEMLRRIQIMDAVAGGKCNDFYVQMLPKAERNIKNELIYALRHNKDNVELLLELIKQEKGNAKNMAYFALAEIEDERAENVFREMSKKKPMDTMIFLKMSVTKWASGLVAEFLTKQLSICQEADYGKGEKVFTLEETEMLSVTIDALTGKNGKEICEAYRTAYLVKDIYYKNPEEKKIRVWKTHIGKERLYVKTEPKRFEQVIAYFLELAIRMNKDEEVCALAEELYTRSSGKDKEELYFPAVLVTRLLNTEDCTNWLREKIYTTVLFKEKKNKAISPYLTRGLSGLVYDEKKEAYILQTEMMNRINDVQRVYQQPITQDIAGRFTDLLITYCMSDVDRILKDIVNPKNKELCKKLEDYFYDRALTGVVEEYSTYWKALEKCGCKRCEGLLSEYLKRSNSEQGINGWSICTKLWQLPGDVESFEKETNQVYKLISEGKIKVQRWNETLFFEYAENVKEKKQNVLEEKTED